MRLELVGGRPGQGQPLADPAGQTAAGTGRPAEPDLPDRLRRPDVQGGDEGGELADQLAEAQRLIVGIRQRLTELADRTAALRQRLETNSERDRGPENPGTPLA